MIYLEYMQYWESVLIVQEQEELLAKIKKPIAVSEEYKLKNDDGLGGNITDVKIENGIIKTYLKGKKEPIRSYAEPHSVNMAMILKNIIILLAKNLGRMGNFKRLIILLAIFYNQNIFLEWIERIFNTNVLLLKDEYWSQPVKEIRRVMKGNKFIESCWGWTDN